ncbi:MAG: amidohydrolase family protein [Saprospiraceae bacterium]|nr:amidohydrolase family protein [Saprospiraceae bacterium]
MKSIKFIHLCLLLLIIGCIPPKNTNPISPYLIIKNINIIDVLKGEIIPNQEVVVKNKLIYFIGKSFSGKVPSHSIYINGKGKYLSPSLWDMHFHLCWDKNNDTLLYSILLKNGITGIRDMGGDLIMMQRFKEKLKKSLEIFGAGPMIDGNPPVYADFSLSVDDNTAMMAVLDSLKNKGADFFKTYSLIKEPQLKDISTYCTKNNTHFAGHLSEYIEPETSISLGQKSVEHLNRLDEIWQVNKNRLDSIGHLMQVKKTFICPTLITYQLKTKIKDSSIINKEYNKYIPTVLMNEWKTTWAKRAKRVVYSQDLADLDNRFIAQLALVKHLHEMGIMILAGSDFAGMPYVYPGIGLHQELNLLAKAGLSNNEILKTATINPAIYRGVQQMNGSISVGKYADMLILERNPLENIAYLKSINTVIWQGNIYNTAPQ